MRLSRFTAITLPLASLFSYAAALYRLRSAAYEAPDFHGSAGSVEINGHTVGFRSRSLPGQRHVVLVHGWGSSGDLTWSKFTSDESVSFLSLDLPGYGGSSTVNNVSIEKTAHLFNMAVQSLGFQGATLVGHSYGGLVASSMIQQGPHLYKSAVLVSSALSFNVFPVGVFVRVAPFFFSKGSPLTVLSALRSSRKLGSGLSTWRWSQRPGLKTMRALSRAAVSHVGHYSPEGVRHWIIPENDKCVPPRLQEKSVASGDCVTFVEGASHGFVEVDPAAVLEVIKSD